MYAAYQSHQSCGGATASNEPWWMGVSFSSAARAATSVGSASQVRPGSREVISWRSQTLPSGSLNDA